MNDAQSKEKKPASENSGILKGVGTLIDEHLALILGPGFGLWKTGNAPHYTHKGIYKLFKQMPSQSNFNALTHSILARITANYEKRPNSNAKPSPSNWHEKQQPHVAENSKSVEKKLEKRIVQILGGRGWSNQIPAASDFTGIKTNRKRSIDLCWRMDASHAALLELKWKSNNPVYAAFEILNYGMLYIFARQSLSLTYKEQPLMNTNKILLAVLAPQKEFYSKYSSAVQDWLEKSLSEAISSMAAEYFGSDFKMGFCFLEFHADFEYPCQDDSLDLAMTRVEKLLEKKLCSL